MRDDRDVSNAPMCVFRGGTMISSADEDDDEADDDATQQTSPPDGVLTILFP